MTRQEKINLLNEIFFKPKEMIVDDRSLNLLVDTLDDVCYQSSPTISKLNQLKDYLKDIKREIERVEEECA